MPAMKLYKETAVPGTLEANAIYLITDPGDANLVSVYVTNAAGSATRRTPTYSDIQAMIAAATGGTTYVVADITARDALTPSTGMQAMVVDATADGTVASGAATYIYDGAAWVKISEAESMDLSLNWTDITGRPSSSAAAIDGAVTNSHTHSNKTQLDKVGEDGSNNPTYNGANFAMVGSTNW